MEGPQLFKRTFDRLFCDTFFSCHKKTGQKLWTGMGAKAAISPEPSEPELVAALRRGEARAFDWVYARYRVRIYRFLVRLAGRRDVADDLFQETFLQLARHARSLRPDTDLMAFLYTVARNRYRNHRRMTLFRLGRLRALLLGGQPAPSVVPSSFPLGTPPTTPFDEAVAEDTAQKLSVGLARLSPSLREVLLLCAVEGLEIDAVSRILGRSPSTLRQRLSRARAQLEDFLKRSV